MHVCKLNTCPKSNQTQHNTHKNMKELDAEFPSERQDDMSVQECKHQSQCLGTKYTDLTT